MEKIEIVKQISTLKQILEGLEQIFDTRTPKNTEVSQEELNQLRHWAIFVHTELEGGMSRVILQWLFPKAGILKAPTQDEGELTRAVVLYIEVLDKMSFDRLLSTFKLFAKQYELDKFDPELMPLITKVKNIRNDLAHPIEPNLKKYVTCQALHQAYVDLVDCITAFKSAIEKVKRG